MPELKPTRDSRTSYDEKTGAVRSIFGVDLVEPSAKRNLTKEKTSDDFLEANMEMMPQNSAAVPS